jgi:hypothetical protein
MGGITQVDATLVGNMEIRNDLFVAGDILLTSGDFLTVWGNCVADNITVTNLATSFSIFGDCWSPDCDLTVAAGMLFWVYGNGKFHSITNAGTVGFRGTWPETAININAITASETDVINFGTTDYYQWTLDKLRLKSVDPGANTVTVRLYELINGALTLVDTFDITNANFATYFSLMDMFGLQNLHGDNLQITVQASAGGPYAVTGSYSHRRE